MKLISIIVLIILGFLFYPQLIEDTGSSWAALERQVVRLVTKKNKKVPCLRHYCLEVFQTVRLSMKLLNQSILIYPQL